MRVNQLTGHTVWPLAPRLLALVERFQQVYFCPDPGPLLIALGAYAAHRIDKLYPVWLMLVGGPSTGKTVIVDLLEKCDRVHTVSDLTKAGLLSATKEKDRSRDADGGLLRAVGDNGFLSFKDFTSIITLPQMARDAIISALREIYDGKWTRRVGTDGSRNILWEGRLGVIAGCTSVIDDQRKLMAEMGDRFLYYRMPVFTAEQDERMAMKAIRLNQLNPDGNLVYESMAQEVKDFFAQVPTAQPALPGEDYQECLACLSILVSRCRSSCTWDWKKSEIENVQSPEGPSRLVRQLSALDNGLDVLGVPEVIRYNLIRKTALYSAPPIRLDILNELAPGPRKAGEPVGKTIGQVKAKFNYGQATLYRAFDELKAQDIIKPDKQGGGNVATRWTMTDDWLERWNRAPEGAVVSKESGGVIKMPPQPLKSGRL